MTNVIPEKILHEIREVLTPFFLTESERRALIGIADPRQRLITLINWNGNAKLFTENLLNLCISQQITGKELLHNLLNEVCEQVEDKQQTYIKQLLLQLNPLFEALQENTTISKVFLHDDYKAIKQQTIIARDRSQITVVEQQNITSVTKDRALLISLVFIVGIITLVLVTFAILPEQQRNTFLVAINVLPPTATFTLTPTPSPTPTETPSLAQYDIGIAVSYFALPDNQINSIQADTLVEQIYARLRSELEEFAQEINLTIGFIAPSTVGRIVGVTSQEREVNAEDIAQRFNATLVLYGVIHLQNNGLLNIQPEFYVSSQAFTEALEMTGSYRFGREITVDGTLTNIRNAMSVNRPLSARATSLVEVFGGLIHYALENYDQALISFEAAMSSEVQDTDGREVIHVLLGNTYGKLAAVAAQNRDFDTSQQNVEHAVREYTTASRIAPEYSRPYTGLASVTYLQWNIEFQETEVSDQSLLEQGLEYLNEAQNALDQSQDIGIQTRELFIHLQLSYALRTFNDNIGSIEVEDLDSDIQLFANQIIRRYDNGRNPSVQELASESYSFLGLFAYSEARWEDAIEYFSEAIRLSLSAYRRIFFYGWIGDCQVELNEIESAIEAYTMVIEIAELTRDFPLNQIQFYRDKIEQLRGRS